MQIHEITEPIFRQYGKVIKNLDTAELEGAMLKKQCPDDVIYVASDAELEKLACAKKIQYIAYGEVPIQIGYCNGHNLKLNGLEYHRCSELNMACGSDAVLFLGKQSDIKVDFTYDTANVLAFRLPQGVFVEIFATTLHYAPCHVSEDGFRVVVVLGRGTNEELEFKHETDIDPKHGQPDEDRLLMAKNKWLLAHPDGRQDKDAFLGLIGENISL